MKRIIRERKLTDEEAAEYRTVRAQAAAELPDLVARHHERVGSDVFRTDCEEKIAFRPKPTA